MRQRTSQVELTCFVNNKLSIVAMEDRLGNSSLHDNYRKFHALRIVGEIYKLPARPLMFSKVYHEIGKY